MCEPTTIMIAMAASGAMQAYGQYQQGKAQEAASKYQAQVNENNAIIAEREAAAAEERGKDAEGKQRRLTAQFQAQQEAAYAKSGVLMDSGSPLDILSDTAALGEIDALTIRQNYMDEAYNQRRQADNFRNEAELNRFSGRNAARAGTMNAFSTLLSTAGNTYAYGNKVGAFGSVQPYSSATGSAGASASRFRNGTVVRWNN